MVIDWRRIILSILVDAANISDSKLLLPHVPYLKKILDKPKVMATDAVWDIQTLYQSLAQANIALFAATNVRRNKHKRKLGPRVNNGTAALSFVGIKPKNHSLPFANSPQIYTTLSLLEFSYSKA